MTRFVVSYRGHEPSTIVLVPSPSGGFTFIEEGTNFETGIPPSPKKLAMSRAFSRFSVNGWSIHPFQD